MDRYTVSPTQVVRESLAVILSYAVSIEPMQRLVEVCFDGEWKQLRQTVFGLPRQRAERACLELALFLRYMDDEKLIPSPYKDKSAWPYGTVFYEGGKQRRLGLREVTNKIIHAQRLDWEVTAKHKPKLVCIARPNSTEGRGQRVWTKAEVALPTLAALSGAFL